MGPSKHNGVRDTQAEECCDVATLKVLRCTGTVGNDYQQNQSCRKQGKCEMNRAHGSERRRRARSATNSALLAVGLSPEDAVVQLERYPSILERVFGNAV
jgi:hypothetical protein